MHSIMHTNRISRQTRTKALCFLFLICGAICLKATPIEGTITAHNITVGDVLVEEAIGKYRLDTFMGEPLMIGVFKYRGNGPLSHTTRMVLTCVCPGQGIYYIFFDTSIPPNNGDFGYDSPGSPNWDRFFKREKSLDSEDYLSAEEAKTFWKAGIHVSNFTLLAKSLGENKSTTPSKQEKKVPSLTDNREQDRSVPTKDQSESMKQTADAQQEESRRKQEVSRLQQEEAAKIKRAAEQRAHEADLDRERQIAAAQERMSALRRKQAKAEQQRQEAEERYRDQKEAARQEERRKVDAMVLRNENTTKQIISGMDQIGQDAKNTIDQWARNRQKAEAAEDLEKQILEREMEELREKIAELELEAKEAQ